MDNTRVYTVSETGKTLTTAMGMTVTPKYSLADAPEPDILVVPGGAADNAYDNPKVVAWVAAKAQKAEHVMSVCNGAFILAKAGLLDGKKATTFYGLIDALRAFAPKTTIVTDQRFVDNGKVITSAGLSSGIDASLYLVSKIQGMARAKQLALHLEYDWRPDSTFARAALADMRLPSFAPPDGVETTLVATTGDRNQWERRFSIKGAITSEALMSYMVEKISALPGWSLEPQRTHGTAGRVEGTFKDADGVTWKSSTLIEPSQEAGALMVTMTIEKRGAPGASGH
jgi:putative intracellular protease/amidase